MGTLRCRPATRALILALASTACAHHVVPGEVHPTQLLTSNGGCAPPLVANGHPPPAACLPDSAAINTAMHRFAPEVHLYPKSTRRQKGLPRSVADSGDLHRPSSVAWYLKRARLRWHQWSLGPLWPDISFLPRGTVDNNSLLRQSHRGQSSGSGTARSAFFLQIDREWKREVILGNLDSAECYVRFRGARNGEPGFEIQYWFFYPYSGDITKLFTTAHEADWEHITVRVDVGLERILSVYFASHDGEGRWYNSGSFSTTADGHPVVYSARRSHASYPEAREYRRPIPKPNDYTAQGGDVWRTWERLVLLGEPGNPRPGSEWISFTGRWGERGVPLFSFIMGSSGPYGPAFQDSWHVDP